jgi:hypothetical protein
MGVRVKIHAVFTLPPRTVYGRCSHLCSGSDAVSTIAGCGGRDRNLATHLWHLSCLAWTRLMLCVAVFKYINWGEVLSTRLKLKATIKVLLRGAYEHYEVWMFIEGHEVCTLFWTSCAWMHFLSIQFFVFRF